MQVPTSGASLRQLFWCSAEYEELDDEKEEEKGDEKEKVGEKEATGRVCFGL